MKIFNIFTKKDKKAQDLERVQKQFEAINCILSQDISTSAGVKKMAREMKRV